MFHTTRYGLKIWQTDSFFFCRLWISVDEYVSLRIFPAIPLQISRPIKKLRRDRCQSIFTRTFEEEHSKNKTESSPKKRQIKPLSYGKVAFFSSNTCSSVVVYFRWTNSQITTVQASSYMNNKRPFKFNIFSILRFFVDERQARPGISKKSYTSCLFSTGRARDKGSINNVQF